MKRLMLACALVLVSVALSAQQPMPSDGWPTYNGDYSGRRFSTLTKVNDKNVQHLSLAWAYRLSVPGAGPIKGTPLMINGVIYLTAHADLATMERAASTEPLGYVFKPFSHDMLRTALLRATGRAGASPQ